MSDQTVKGETYPAERHYVERVAAAIDLVKEVTVGVMGCVVYLELTPRIPVDGAPQKHLSNTGKMCRNEEKQTRIPLIKC